MAEHIVSALNAQGIASPFPIQASTIPVALGGLGNNRGAVIGGILLGLFQQAANFTVGGIFSSVAVFTLFIIVLLLRPQGLFKGLTR